MEKWGLAPSKCKETSAKRHPARCLSPFFHTGDRAILAGIIVGRPIVSRRYLLPCPCGRKTPVQGPQAGQRVRCECGAELNVPTMLGLAELEELVERESDSAASQRAWGIREVLLLLGGIVFLVGMAALIALWTTWPKAPDMLRLSPFQAMGMWDEFQQGISAEPSPPEKRYLAASRSHRQWLVLAGTVAIVGALIIGSAFLVKPRPPQETPLPD